VCNSLLSVDSWSWLKAPTLTQAPSAPRATLTFRHPLREQAALETPGLHRSSKSKLSFFFIIILNQKMQFLSISSPRFSLLLQTNYLLLLLEKECTY